MERADRHGCDPMTVDMLDRLIGEMDAEYLGWRQEGAGK
jgi:hypothetical protein